MSESEANEPRSSQRSRAPRHVKAAARLLEKEAGRILRRHRKRLTPQASREIRETVVEVEENRRAGDIQGLEAAAERLDELLQQHASFARKSALRETIENILVAVLVALGLRSCLYEPFKIPSGSMMPTLRAGDHIFVNKFVYGVQIPFTNTVVGKQLGEIERGDVIVFRYPVDESEDFIKRVIGLPGDEIKVRDRDVFIKRAGESQFAQLQRTPLEQPCYDETDSHVVEDCQLYRETLGDHSYRVRYRAAFDRPLGGGEEARLWKVPDGHLLVMGDNRNESHDSLAWTVTVAAVSARGLLSVKDLRDLTPDKRFTVTTPRDPETITDAKYDHVVYLADHRSPTHDLQLSVWRDPSLGVPVVFDAVVDGLSEPRHTSVAELVDDMTDVNSVEEDRWIQAADEIDRLVLAKSEQRREAALALEDDGAVLHLRCGIDVCDTDAQIVRRLMAVLEAFARDHGQDARELLAPAFDGEGEIRYTPHWTSRADPDDRFVHRRFVRRGGGSHRGVVDFRAWRHPDEGLAQLRAAGLRALGVDSIEAAEPVPALGDQAWMVERRNMLGLLLVSPEHGVVALLQCGRARCSDRDALLGLGRTIQRRIPEAAKDRQRFGELLAQGDAGAFPETPVSPRRRYEFDRVTLQGTVRGARHRLDLEAWLQPTGGLNATMQDIKAELPELRPDPSVVRGGLLGRDEDAFVLALPIPESETVIQIRCSRGLCRDADVVRALGERAATKARDPSQFIDPDAERPRPFVPRGNVKGRAERIWLPLDRFWLPIR